MSADHVQADQGSTEETDDSDGTRALVRLAFRATLRRDPEAGDAAAFTNALRAGMSMHSFLSELMAAPEYGAGPPTPPTAEALPARGRPASDLLALSSALLQARLVDKGCLVQLGPTDDSTTDTPDTACLERVIRTLSVLDRL